MKKKGIKEGGRYLAKVSGKLVTVRVDCIREQDMFGKTKTVYDVTNLTTGRKTVFRSAQRFRPGVKYDTPNPTKKVEERHPEEPKSNRKFALAKAFKKRKDAGTDRAPHVIVEARAGTGKTTTLVEGLKLLKGLTTVTSFLEPRFEPMPQQTAIWKEMLRSQGKAQTICFVAFNKSIASELQARVPQGCNAMTMHSMGFRAIRHAYGRVQMEEDRVLNIISELLERDLRDLRRTKWEVLQATRKLVDLCKMNLVGFLGRFPEAGKVLSNPGLDNVLVDLAAHYDVELNGNSREVFDLIPRVLERCKRVDLDGQIDFSDMIWLPVVLNLQVQKYDLLLVDEAQDLNRCQQELAKKAGRRLILCGDPKQAIYGFAGANAESMARLERELSQRIIRAVIDECTPNVCLFADGKSSSQLETLHDTGDPKNLCRCVVEGRGCIHLPLTVTRRCGKAIVKEAQKYVPDFEAHESCGEGFIAHMSFKECASDRNCPKSRDGSHFYNSVHGQKEPPTCVSCGCEVSGIPHYGGFTRDGDMILCRVNAPLVSECFRFLKQGRSANIQGRDVGRGLISTIKRSKAITVTGLIMWINRWLQREMQKEQAKRNPKESRLIALQDRHDCITCFAEDQTTVDGVVRRIEAVFTDQKNGRGIMLSSIHKAKGLEARRVFILQPEGAEMPHPMAKSKWQREQEFNLLYVAITRAIEELVYVS